MNIIKMVCKVLLGLIVMISLLGAVYSWEISNTLLNKEFILKEMEEQNYYENVYSDVLNEMKGYLAPSGLDEKVLNNLITTEKIKEDTQLLLSNLYEHKEETIETITIRNKLDANIEGFLQENNLKVNNQESIEEFKNKIIEEYEKGISYNIYTKYSEKIPFQEIQTKIRKIKGACLIGLVFSILGYLLLDLKKSYEVMSFVLASGIIISGMVILIMTQLKIDNIMLLNDAISIMIRDMTKSILYDIMTIGGILIVISLVIIVLGNIRKVYREDKRTEK